MNFYHMMLIIACTSYAHNCDEKSVTKKKKKTK